MRIISGNRFYVPRPKWISGHEAHFFTEFVAYSRYLVTIHPSLFHNGKPQSILSLLFHSLEVDALMHELYDVLGIRAIQDLLTSLLLPVFDQRSWLLPGWRPKVADVDANNHPVPGLLIPHDLMQHNENDSYKLLGLED